MAADSDFTLPSHLASLPLSPAEKAAFAAAQFPPLISPHLGGVLERLSRGGAAAAAWYRAMGRQFFPMPEEERTLPCELEDPLGARSHQATPRMVHQYKNRVLILTTGRCFAHCRYCFRKNQLHAPTHSAVPDFLAEGDIEAVCRYLAAHPEVQEALLSGGDPLTVPFPKLEELVCRLRAARPNLLVRLGTRASLFAPKIFTAELVEKLRRLKPLWVVPHINHPAEISEVCAPESRRALVRLVEGGIPVQSQTVLLRGVNDDTATLSRLFHELTCLGIKPGYLFQCDLVPGTSHLRVPVEEGIRLYEALRRELSGLSTPVYAVDLPGGGGKFNLLQLDPALQAATVERLDTSYCFTAADGSRWFYPR